VSKLIDELEFEVSGLEDSPNNALKRYEVKFSEPVNADWLIRAIKISVNKENELRHLKPKA